MKPYALSCVDCLSNSCNIALVDGRRYFVIDESARHERKIKWSEVQLVDN
jgi:hypothetical protein